MLLLLKVLIEAAKLYDPSMNDLKMFLSAIYHKTFPNRGESLTVRFGAALNVYYNNNKSYFLLIFLYFKT